MLPASQNCSQTQFGFNLKLFLLLISLISILLLPLASASHQMDVTISPVYTTGDVNKSLELTIENSNASTDSIWQVKIVKNGDYETECLKLAGWSLNSQPGYCTYTTTDKIAPGSAATFSLDVTVPDAQGAYNWDIYTTDSASPNQGSSTTVSTRVDTEPPVTSISPDGASVGDSQTSFTLDCEDNQGQIQSGCFKSFYKVVEGGECLSLNYTEGNSGSISCSGQLCQRQVCYYSIDQAGNWEERKISSPFILDAEQPSLSQLQVSPHFKINKTDYVRGTVTVSAQATDQGTGLASVSFQVTGQNTSQGCQGSEQETDVWSCSLDTTELPDGLYSLSVAAEDKAGNQATREDYSFYVSNQQPILDLIESATIRFTYSEDDLDQIKEESLQLYQYDTEENTWEEVGGELNPEENYIEMPITDTSQFTLFGNMKETVEEKNETEECQPNWTCTDWTECINDTMTRNCTDLNQCGTEEGKPEMVKDCVEICQPNWTCTNWTGCTNGTRTRNCTDLNQCGTDETRPVGVKGCEGCEENWVCTDWEEIECTNGTKTRECIEWNNCAGEDELPTRNETIDCDSQQQPQPEPVGGMSARRKLGIAVLVILIVIIALVLYYR